jgi:RNA polymerase sigma-70 factor (ECF subfamily)
MSEQEEDELIARLRQRDAQAFTQFFESYADRVYRLAFHLLGNEPDADEVVQATFLSAFEALDRFVPHAKVSTWLYRIAYNHSLMLLRRRHPTEPLPDDDDAALPVPGDYTDWSRLPEAQVLAGEAQAMLRAAIGELPQTLRAAFVLRDIEQLSTTECAQVQSISETLCKVRLHRARLRLRDQLSAYFDEWVVPSHKEPS